ncbi:MAG: ABC transporter ATP-binding protein [Geminicoccaceae bacterium]|nr:ABC transporter ATP-binding protein [Geminicoccaceae bacterium]
MTAEPLLKVEGLQGWYGESHVLHGVDIEVRQGETVTLLGRNGAGKTTTLRAIMGILGRAEGRVRFAGDDLLGLPLHKVARRGIGYVPEERGIFAGLDVMENLTLPPRNEGIRLSLDELRDLFPNLDERRHSQGTKLSGGEQQMLAIARTLHAGARLLLLDEPTEGLAPVIVQRIGEVVRTLKARGMTILLVEQNFRFARRVADRHYVMEDGRIVGAFDAGEVDARMDELHEILGV